MSDRLLSDKKSKERARSPQVPFSINKTPSLIVTVEPKSAVKGDRKRSHFKNSQSKFQGANPSLFNSILIADIEEEKKQKNSGTASRDILIPFGLADLWQEANPFLLHEKSDSVPNIDPQYKQICEIFSKLGMRFTIQPDIELYADRAFSSQFMLTAILSIKHTYNLIIAKLTKIMENEEKGCNDGGNDTKEVQDLYNILKIFNDFFFITAKLRCNTVLNEQHLKLLLEATKLPFQFLNDKVQNNIMLTLDTLNQQTNRSLIAVFIYHTLQTIAALAVFGESDKLSKEKYENIVEKFKTVFVLMAQHMTCEKIFSEAHSFEIGWGKYKRKLIISSFDQKRLSIFLPKANNMLEMPNIEFSLKYVVISYNYKILKVIANRVQYIKYDEHIFSVFSAMANRNRSSLAAILSKKSLADEMALTILINENVYIIKSYILNLMLLSEGLDPIQRQVKYETIKDIALDSIYSVIKAFSHKYPIKDVLGSNIHSPKDLLGLIFKALLTFHKSLEKNIKMQNSSELKSNINALITEMISRPIPSDDPVCFNIYKMYLLQYIMSWDLSFLKEKHVKYTEEMSRYISNFEENSEKDTSYSDDLSVQELTHQVRNLALQMFINLAKIDSAPVIEITISSIRENFTNEKKLRNYFYILTCVLTKNILPYEFFPGLLSWDREQAIVIFGGRDNIEEFKTFIEKGGMRILFANYQNTLASYKSTKAQIKQYNTYIEKNKIITADTNIYALNEHLKKINEAVNLYKILLESTGSFICALHNVVYFTEQYLFHTDPLQEFSENTLSLKGNQKLIKELLLVLQRNSKSNPSFHEKFVSFSLALVRRFCMSKAKPLDKRSLLLHFITLVKGLILEMSPTSELRCKIMHKKAVIPVLVDACSHKEYVGDKEVFLELIRLIRLVVWENVWFREEPEPKAHLIEFYEFMLMRFKELKTIEIAKETLKELLQMSIDSEFTSNMQFRLTSVKDILALEKYYAVLLICFKSLHDNSIDAELLDLYVLSPLKILLQSLYNISIIARSEIPTILLRIFKRTIKNPVASQISNFLGTMASVHATPKQFKKMLRYFSDPPDLIYINEFLKSIFEAILSAISGDSIKEFFYFDGTFDSYIHINMHRPFAYPNPGLCFIGYVRFEFESLRQPQCVFQVLNTTKKDPKFFELTISDKIFVFRLVNSAKEESVVVYFDEVLAKEDTWQRIILFQLGKEITLIVDDQPKTKELSETPEYAKAYNVVVLGARIDVEKNGLPIDRLKGEISACGFFVPSAKIKESLRFLDSEENLIPHVYLNEKELTNYFFEIPRWENRNVFRNDLMPVSLIWLDPRQISISNSGKGFLTPTTLKKVKTFFNRPGKEVFCNVGGLKVVLMLVMEKPYINNNPDKQEYFSYIFIFCRVKIYIRIMRLLHCLCMNKCVQAIKFLTEERGLDYFQLVLEKIAKTARFNNAFVESIFNLLHLPILYNEWSKFQLAALIIEKIALNNYIWENSKFSTKVFFLIFTKYIGNFN